MYSKVPQDDSKQQKPKKKRTLSSMPRGMPAAPLFVFATAVSIVIFLLIWIIRSAGAEEVIPNSGAASVEGVNGATNPLKHEVLGTREVLPEDIEIVYQSPENVGQEATKGLMVLAHGCSHSATDFFDKGQGCQECIGLPVERKIVQESLNRGFVALAVSSVDRGSKCWHPDDDLGRIQKAIKHVRSRLALSSKIPVMALGASSGGRMVFELGVHDPSFTSVAIQIMAVPPQAITQSFPPSIFWHMPRDRRTAGVVALDLEQLRDLNRPVLELKCDPQPLSPKFFSERTREISEETSEAIFVALEGQGLLDESNFLRQDPRQTGPHWREVLTSAVPEIAGGKHGLGADKSSISELMNVAWASHEFCDSGLEEALDFMSHHASNCSNSGKCV